MNYRLKNVCSSILQEDLEGKYRIEFLPIQWRNNIELDEGNFVFLLHKITISLFY